MKKDEEMIGNTHTHKHRSISISINYLDNNHQKERENEIVCLCVVTITNDPPMATYDPYEDIDKYESGEKAAKQGEEIVSVRT